MYNSTYSTAALTSTAAPLLAAVLTSIAPQPTPTLDPALDSPIPALTNETNNGTAEMDEYAAFLAGSRYVVQRILVPVVLVLGVVGNTVTIVVLTRRQMRSSTNSYLTALAISDMLYLIFIFSLSIQHHPGMNRPHHWFYWHYFRYALWLTDASSEYHGSVAVSVTVVTVILAVVLI